MLLLITLLGEVAPTMKEATGEGSWITTKFAAAALGGIAGIVSVVMIAFKAGRAHTVDIKNQPVQVKTVPSAVTWQEMRDLKDRVAMLEAKLDLMKQTQSDQFHKILTSAYEREVRLSEKIDASIRPAHERLDEIFALLAKQSKEVKKA
jgi:hypothetical protein